MFEFSLDFYFMQKCIHAIIVLLMSQENIYIWFFRSAISICDTTCQIQTFLAIRHLPQIHLLVILLENKFFHTN